MRLLSIENENLTTYWINHLGQMDRAIAEDYAKDFPRTFNDDNTFIGLRLWSAKKSKVIYFKDINEISMPRINELLKKEKWIMIYTKNKSQLINTCFIKKVYFENISYEITNQKVVK